MIIILALLEMQTSSLTPDVLIQKVGVCKLPQVIHRGVKFEKQEAPPFLVKNTDTHACIYLPRKAFYVSSSCVIPFPSQSFSLR